MGDGKFRLAIFQEVARDRRLPTPWDKELICMKLIKRGIKTWWATYTQWLAAWLTSPGWPFFSLLNPGTCTFLTFEVRRAAQLKKPFDGLDAFLTQGFCSRIIIRANSSCKVRFTLLDYFFDLRFRLLELIWNLYQPISWGTRSWVSNQTFSKFECYIDVFLAFYCSVSL